MDKLKNYKGSTELGSGLRPMGDNDFPLAEAHHIQTREDGTRLDEELALIALKEVPIVTIDTPGIVKSSTAENRIMAAADGSGEMEVVSLNMRKLTQTEGDTIILRGKI